MIRPTDDATPKFASKKLTNNYATAATLLDELKECRIYRDCIWGWGENYPLMGTLKELISFFALTKDDDVCVA